MGEEGLVRNMPHTTTATATEATTCIEIDSHLLERMVTGDSELAVRFIKGLADRLAATHELLSMLGERDSRTRVCMAIVRHAEMSDETTGEGIWIRSDWATSPRKWPCRTPKWAKYPSNSCVCSFYASKRDGILVPDVSAVVWVCGGQAMPKDQWWALDFPDALGFGGRCTLKDAVL